MQSVDLWEIKRLVADFDALLRQLPEEKEAMLEEIGQAILREVRGRIGGRGKVQSWQERYIGSRLGYVAVRAKANTRTEEGYAVGYVTNAIENGHRQQPGRYVPALGKALKAGRVMGKGFYRDARTRAESVAYVAAERFARTLAAKLEGK